MALVTGGNYTQRKLTLQSIWPKISQCSGASHIYNKMQENKLDLFPARSNFVTLDAYNYDKKKSEINFEGNNRYS